MARLPEGRQEGQVDVHLYCKLLHRPVHPSQMPVLERNSREMFGQGLFGTRWARSSDRRYVSAITA
jgi:hypothetical protein